MTVLTEIVKGSNINPKRRREQSTCRKVLRRKTMLDYDFKGCLKNKFPQVDKGSKKGGPRHKKAMAYTEALMSKTAQSIQRNA